MSFTFNDFIADEELDALLALADEYPAIWVCPVCDSANDETSTRCTTCNEPYEVSSFDGEVYMTEHSLDIDFPNEHSA